MTALSPVVCERFWDKVDRSGGAGACWPWTATRTGNGYGNFKASIWGHMPAHRVAVWISTGEYVDHKLVVRHSCDNPICCNPAHLQVGTQGENIQDQYDRKRRCSRRSPVCY